MTTRMRGVVSLAVAGAVILVLVGCAKATATHPVTAAPVPTAVTTATPTPVPTLDPQGTAQQNLAYFDRVGHALLDTDSRADGVQIVDWFVAHGFQKTAMEITPDKTAIGLNAWNIEFSVRINGACLIGQSGNVGFQSTVAPLLATGRCLIGQTRVINW